MSNRQPPFDIAAFKSDSFYKVIKKRRKNRVITALEWFGYAILFAYNGDKLTNKTKFSVQKRRKSKR